MGSTSKGQPPKKQGGGAGKPGLTSSWGFAASSDFPTVKDLVPWEHDSVTSGVLFLDFIWTLFALWVFLMNE